MLPGIVPRTVTVFCVESFRNKAPPLLLQNISFFRTVSLMMVDYAMAQAVSHKYCVSTREFIETEDSYVLVMEYVGGGELFMKLTR